MWLAHVGDAYPPSDVCRTCSKTASAMLAMLPPCSTWHLSHRILGRQPKMTHVSIREDPKGHTQTVCMPSDRLYSLQILKNTQKHLVRHAGHDPCPNFFDWEEEKKSFLSWAHVCGWWVSVSKRERVCERADERSKRWFLTTALPPLLTLNAQLFLTEIWSWLEKKPTLAKDRRFRRKFLSLVRVGVCVRAYLEVLGNDSK